MAQSPCRGADEGNKGVLSSLRIENRVWATIVIIMFAGVPFIDVNLSTISFDRSRSEQCQVNVPLPSETGWSKSFTTLNNYGSGFGWNRPHANFDPLMD